MLEAHHFLRRKMLPIIYNAPQCPNASVENKIRGPSISFDCPIDSSHKRVSR